MTLQEALNVFGLSGNITLETIKKTYKKLSLKYHPDRNPNGAEMMKLLNAALECVNRSADRLDAGFTHDEAAYNYGETFNAILAQLKALDGLSLEVIGNWIWITGETKANKDALKSIGCRYASTKKCWYFRPEEHRSQFNRKSHTLEEIREMHGSHGRHQSKGRQRLQGRKSGRTGLVVPV